MNRTVVNIEPGPQDPTMRLFRGPTKIVGARKPGIFNCDPDNMPLWNQAGAVQLHGAKIRGVLDSNPAIKEALDLALRTTEGDVSPIFFHLMVEEAERLYWETLFDATLSFVTLDGRWPIARMADAADTRSLPSTYDFKPPLKVMALISALHRDGRPEWEALQKAAGLARQIGLPVQFLVLVGEEKLLREIQDAIDRHGLTDVQVKPVPDRTSALEGAIEDFAPHILHFFCHGSASLGVAQLEVATALDWMTTGKDTGSLGLGVDALSRIPAMKQVWLVTLNCCEGGKAANNLHSMAHALVSYGIPAAVGMLEPINADDAHEFCEGFYQAIFRKLDTVLDGVAVGKSAEVEWAEALRLPRGNLRENHANDPINHREWALPVLYVRPEVFYVRKLEELHLQTGVVGGVAPEPVSPDVRKRIEVVAGALRALPPDSPEEARQQLLLEVLADVPESLRPDSSGNFPDGGD